jgi:hypothetical protein
MRKVKKDYFIDPRVNFARSWRDSLPVQPAEEEDPMWLKVLAALAFLALLFVMALL